MKTIIMGLALALGLGTLAQAQAFDPDRRMTHFTPEAIETTLDELGAKHSGYDDRPNIRIEFANKMIADALLMACEDQAASTNCRGTSILATFEKPEKSDAAIQSAVNQYNYNKNFGRAYIDPDGVISLRMYIISDGEITMENYRIQIELFAVSAEDFFTYLYD